MDLLHLGSHRLDTAQNLILVCDGCDANSCQVPGGGGEKKRGPEKLHEWRISFPGFMQTHI